MAGMSERAHVGLHEIATMLGVSRQRADQLARRPGFPVPERLKAGRVWVRVEVERWMRENGRHHGT